MGKSIIDGTKPKHVIFAIILTVISAAALYFISANVAASIIVIIAFAVSMLSVFFISRSISRKLGGITGDVIGFVIETSSLIYVSYLLRFNGRCGAYIMKIYLIRHGQTKANAEKKISGKRKLPFYNPRP